MSYCSRAGGKAALALGIVLAVCGPAQSQPDTFETAEAAFLAGVKGCQSRFQGIKARQPFDDPKAFRGFAPAPDSRDAPGVRSLLLGVSDALVLKGTLPPGSIGSVHVVISRGGLPRCQTIATDAPAAHQAALAWFDDPKTAWATKGPEESSEDPFPMRSRLYGQPFQGNVGVGATLMWATSDKRGAITALSTMSLARDR